MREAEGIAETDRFSFFTFCLLEPCCQSGMMVVTHHSDQLGNRAGTQHRCSME